MADDRSDGADEMESLNLDDMDVEELERRVEMSTMMLAPCYVNACGADCGTNCVGNCPSNCVGNCGANCGGNCSGLCASNHCSNYAIP